MGMYVVTELEVCDDCLMIIANGECGHCHDHDTSECPAGTAQVDKWGSDAVHLVLACGDCESDGCGFSWTKCDGCGSTLGGNRHSAALLRPDYSNMTLERLRAESAAANAS